MSKPSLLHFVLVTLALSPRATLADVKPHGLFTENMVLQQGTTVPIWGTAAKALPLAMIVDTSTVPPTPQIRPRLVEGIQPGLSRKI